ncbi:hypothetical protein EV424DRAFT_1534481 [Suillus variegatus]|nr:hypothetical protein EV424DRAFT_1534481 [Suillus variegatus]
MKLTSLDNSFESVNCIQCFNHTLQLSAKALLKPFNSESLSASEADDDVDVADSDELPLILDDDLEVEEVDFTSKLDDTDDDIDELEMLLQAKHEKMLDDTVAVKATIAKIHGPSFAVICSTTLLLPAWRQACVASHLKEKLMLCDVATFLSQYKKATLFFSQDSASIAAVIPVIDKLDSKLNQQTKDSYHPAVILAMQLAKNKMDRY